MVSRSKFITLAAATLVVSAPAEASSNIVKPTSALNAWNPYARIVTREIHDAFMQKYHEARHPSIFVNEYDNSGEVGYSMFFGGFAVERYACPMIHSRHDAVFYDLSSRVAAQMAGCAAQAVVTLLRYPDPATGKPSCQPILPPCAMCDASG